MKKFQTIGTNTNREFVTCLETVSASGKVIPPFIVWSAKSHIAGYYELEGEKNIEASEADMGLADVGFAYSESGYRVNFRYKNTLGTEKRILITNLFL